jgi:hypothetical protein
VQNLESWEEARDYIRRRIRKLQYSLKYLTRRLKAENLGRSRNQTARSKGHATVFKTVPGRSSHSTAPEPEPEKTYHRSSPALHLEVNGQKLSMARIESGEDYLYPRGYFVPVRVPQSGEKAVRRAANSSR